MHTAAHLMLQKLKTTENCLQTASKNLFDGIFNIFLLLCTLFAIISSSAKSNWRSWVSSSKAAGYHLPPITNKGTSPWAALSPSARGGMQTSSWDARFFFGRTQTTKHLSLYHALDPLRTYISRTPDFGWVGNCTVFKIFLLFLFNNIQKIIII